MSPVVGTRPVQSTSWFRAILLTGLLVGLADYLIGFGVFVLWLGRPVLGVFQHPAAGLLGPAAYRGGLDTAALGTALHFAIAFGWAAAFALLYRVSPALRRAAAAPFGLGLTATIAGIIIWLAMNNVVIALSQIRPYTLSSALFWIVLIGHIPFVGLPLVWAIRRYAPARPLAVTSSGQSALGPAVHARD
jgi:hypothetical protein